MIIIFIGFNHSIIFQDLSSLILWFIFSVVYGLRYLLQGISLSQLSPSVGAYLNESANSVFFFFNEQTRLLFYTSCSIGSPTSIVVSKKTSILICCFYDLQTIHSHHHQLTAFKKPIHHRSSSQITTYINPIKVQSHQIHNPSLSKDHNNRQKCHRRLSTTI